MLVLRPFKTDGAPAFLLQCSSRAKTAIANIFRDLDFPRFSTRHVQRCNAAFALRGCAIDDPTAAKACYNKAQAVEIRVPLD
jgi:hypothetical protein